MASNTSRTQTSLKLYSNLRVFITDILGETIQFLQNRFKQAKSVFTLSSPFGQILIVLENLTQLIFYYIEDSTTEQNIHEASRPSSIYSLASLAGHNPSRAISATGEVQLQVKSNLADIPTNKVLLPNYIKLRCLNNNLFYVAELPQDELRFSLTGIDNNLKFSIRQGQVESQTFTAKGTPFSSFQVGFPNNFFIDNFLVNVYVNGEKWKKYDSLLDIPKNAKGYILKTGVTNGLDIFMGNGSLGAIPPAGATIVVEYLVTDGSAGILRTDDPRQVYFEFTDTAFTLLGDEVNLNDFVDVITTSPPNFGADPEPLELTRLVAPHASKNFALVHTDNYEILLAKLQLFSAVRVSLDPNDDRVFNLFLIPDTKKFYKNGEDYFSIDTQKFVLSAYQKQQLLAYIAKMGTQMASTDIKIVDPTLTKYIINVSTIIFDDVDDEVVKADIINALGDYFIKASRNDRIPKSDLIAVLEEINGIDSVSVNVICERNELAKSLNPSSVDIGIDQFNDIIIGVDEFPIIRGGWKDRFGNEYVEGLSETALGAVNIQIKDRVTRKISFNAQ